MTELTVESEWKRKARELIYEFINHCDEFQKHLDDTLVQTDDPNARIVDAVDQVEKKIGHISYVMVLLAMHILRDDLRKWLEQHPL